MIQQIFIPQKGQEALLLIEAKKQKQNKKNFHKTVIFDYQLPNCSANSLDLYLSPGLRIS